eukprot:g32385.t1
MLALRRWEQQKRLGEDCQNHLAKLEDLIFSIEMAQTTRGTVEALKTGVAMMKRIQKDIGGVDQVQRLLGDQEEAIEAQQEIAAMLAGDGVEDAEMLSEFPCKPLTYFLCTRTGNIAGTMASLLGQRRLSPCQQDHHNLIVDVIDKEMIHEKRHPAEDKTPGKVLALWGDESHDEDFYAPYFSSKPMNFDGEFSRMRHCLGVVSHRGHKPEQPNQDNFFVLVRKESVLMGILDGHGPHGHSVAHFAQDWTPKTDAPHAGGFSSTVLYRVY